MTVRRRAALLVVAAALAACGGSGYEYVANRQEGVFFKVPDDWRVFDTDELYEADDAAGRWARGFDAAPVPDPQRVFLVASDAPRGLAEVRTLSQPERQQVSLRWLRSVGFGTDADGTPVDPLVLAQQNPDGLEILRYEELVLDDGRGLRLRVEGASSDGVDVVIDQTVLVDHATSKQYLFTVGCTEACWDAHGGEIEEVIDSWTLDATS